MPVKHQPVREQEIQENVARLCAQWGAERNALATVRRFNERLSVEGYAWFWPKIATTFTATHPRLVIACDRCGYAVDLDFRERRFRRTSGRRRWPARIAAG